MTRRVIVIVGRTGTGKTTLAKSIMARHSRVIVLDPLEEYGGVVCRNMDEFFRYFSVLDSPETDPFRVSCRFETEGDIDTLFKAVWILRNVLFVVEEIDTFIRPREQLTPFMQLIRRGRHRRINILGIGQRVPQFSIDLRAQFTTFVTFQQEEPGDIETLVKYGFNLEEVNKLDNHAYLYRRENPDEIRFIT
jgi:hypothetical protein